MTPTQDYLQRADRFGDVVDTERDFLARHDASATEHLPADLAARWRVHRDDLAAAFADEGWRMTEFDGHFGPTTVEEFAVLLYGFDLVVHRWDLGRAAGIDVTWTDAERDSLDAALDVFGDAVYADGVCEPAIDVADSASRQTRLLARLGRAE